MSMRRIALLVLTALLVSAPASAAKGKKKKKRHSDFRGHNALKSTLRTEPLPKPSGEVWLRAENLKEEVKVNIYKPDGSYDDAAIAKLDELFRCSRTQRGLPA